MLDTGGLGRRAEDEEEEIKIAVIIKRALQRIFMVMRMFCILDWGDGNINLHI